MKGGDGCGSMEDRRAGRERGRRWLGRKEIGMRGDGSFEEGGWQGADVTPFMELGTVFQFKQLATDSRACILK